MELSDYTANAVTARVLVNHPGISISVDEVTERHIVEIVDGDLNERITKELNNLVERLTC